MRYSRHLLVRFILFTIVLTVVGCSAVNQGSAAYRFGDASSAQVLHAFTSGMGNPRDWTSGTVACSQPAVAHLCVADGTSRVDMLIARVADTGGEYYLLHFRSTIVSPIPWYWPWSTGWVHDYARKMQQQLGVKAQEVENPDPPRAALAGALSALKERGEIAKSNDVQAVEPKKDFLLLYEPEEWK